jgi:Ca2+/Na+ antiporter
MRFDASSLLSVAAVLSNASSGNGTHPEAEGCEWRTFCINRIPENWWAITLMTMAFAYSFLALAIVCEERLVVSLETLCVRWDVREDIAGASFMAFGSAAPEIIINSLTTLSSIGRSESEADDAAASTNLGIGAILGSGMIAFTLIPGLCAIFSPSALTLKRRPLMRDAGFYAVSIVLLLIAFRDGKIETAESLSFLGVYVIDLIVLVFSPRIRQWFRIRVLAKKPKIRTSFVLSAKEKEEHRKMLEKEGLLDDDSPIMPSQPPPGAALPRKQLPRSHSTRVERIRRRALKKLVEFQKFGGSRKRFPHPDATDPAASSSPDDAKRSADHDEDGLSRPLLDAEHGGTATDAVFLRLEGGGHGDDTDAEVAKFSAQDPDTPQKHEDTGAADYASDGRHSAHGEATPSSSSPTSSSSSSPPRTLSPEEIEAAVSAAASVAAAAAAQGIHAGEVRAADSHDSAAAGKAPPPPSRQMSDAAPPKWTLADMASGGSFVHASEDADKPPVSISFIGPDGTPSVVLSGIVGMDEEEEEEDDFSDEENYGTAEALATVVHEVGADPWASKTPWGKISGFITYPIHAAVKYTSPPCQHDGPHAAWYPLTFFTAFVWVALLSCVIGSIVERWVDMTGFNPALMGLVLIAIGAEVPDTVQSMAVARRGYGSMAVSGSMGSQIVNILIGLGMPWTISNLLGSPVLTGSDNKFLRFATYCLGSDILINFGLLVGVAAVLRHNKAKLNKTKGWILAFAYFAVLGVFIGLTTMDDHKHRSP